MKNYLTLTGLFVTLSLQAVGNVYECNIFRKYSALEAGEKFLLKIDGPRVAAISRSLVTCQGRIDRVEGRYFVAGLGGRHCSADGFDVYFTAGMRSKKNPIRTGFVKVLGQGDFNHYLCGLIEG